MKIRKPPFFRWSQLVILVVFVSGMMLNYFVLNKIIIREQYGRVKGELNFYESRYFGNWDKLRCSEMSIDSLYLELSKFDRYKGNFCILLPSGDYFFDSEGRKGSFRADFAGRFGPVAQNLLESQIANPEMQGWLDYDGNTDRTSYVRNDLKRNVIFFYQFDTIKADRKVRNALMSLFLAMILGGLIIILICLSNIRRMSEKLRVETSARKDLETAAAIQKSMLPRGQEHLMQLDIYATLVPAQKIGGDFYYYVLKEGRLFFCIGDVSGKGVPASLDMCRAVTMFRNLALSGKTPSEIASKMNQELCMNNDQCVFVTAVIGVMDATDGHTVFCNAGHGRPLHWNGLPDSGVDFIEGQGGLPLGFDLSSEYEEYSFTLEKNGLMFLCTDGVNEARRAKGDYYGFGRLSKVLDNNKDKSASAIGEALLEEIHRYVKGAEQSDDITMLVFRNISRPNTLEISNDVKELRKLSGFTKMIFKECPLDDKSSILVRAGLDEAVTNCVNYAYPGQKGNIRISAGIVDKKLVLTLSDSGVPFNPLEYSPVQSDEIKIGGLGIPMMKSAFDELDYSRINNENILTLTKYL